MRVAGAQLGPIARDERRADVVERLIALLGPRPTMVRELVAFPELALTTFFPRWVLEGDELDAFYETEMPGPETKPLFEEAARLGVGFALGYAELADGHRYNTTVAGRRSGHGRRPLPQGPPARARGTGAVATFPAPRTGLLRARRRVHHLVGLRGRGRPCHLQRPALARDLSGTGPGGRRGGAHRVQHPHPLPARSGPGPAGRVPQPAGHAGRGVPERPVGRRRGQGRRGGGGRAAGRELHHRPLGRDRGRGDDDRRRGDRGRRRPGGRAPTTGGRCSTSPATGGRRSTGGSASHDHVHPQRRGGRGARRPGPPAGGADGRTSGSSRPRTAAPLGPVWLLHGPARRQGRGRLPGVAGEGGGPGGRHPGGHRGASALRRRLRRRRRAPVRVLHARDPGANEGAAREGRPDPGEGGPPPRRPPVPLHRLHQDPRRHRGPGPG